MNVNDVLCVGARPVALVDYIAVEEADAELLGPLGQGIALRLRAGRRELSRAESWRRCAR